MRKIDYIVMHCTATDQSAKVSSIVKYWAERLGWRNPGYHFIIDAEGEVTQLQPLDKASNGVRGYNAHSIHVSYIGGKDRDDRTHAQMVAQQAIVKGLHGMFPDAKIQGHCDFPKVRKSCPRFNVAEWLKDIGIDE